MVPVTFSWSKEPLSMQTLTSKGSAEVDSTCTRSPPRTGVLLAKTKMIPHTIEFWDEQRMSEGDSQRAEEQLQDFLNHH